MLLGRVLCVTLFLSVHSYNDYLTHTALDRVPATIGDPLQIRCTKILEKNTDDYREMAICDPQDEATCYHLWTKDGKVLPKSDKYSFKSSITFDYCENFEWSTDIVQKLKLDVGKVDNSDTWYDRDMKCYASALTIDNVREDDLGEYQCHFAKNYTPRYDSLNEDVEVQSINVYNRESSDQLPKKVEYFENFYTKGIKSKLLMQCVVTGAPIVHWFIRSESEKCPRWIDEEWDKCVNITMQPLEDVATMDMWQCYNFTTESHNPYHDEHVTESFIYFENICGMDWGSIYCSADAKGVVRSKGGYIVEKDQWDYWHYWYTGEIIATLGCILIPIVIGLFFVIGAILACVRGKVCSCCNGGYLGARAHPQYQQPVFRYHTAAVTMPNVAPQPSNAPPQQGYAPPQQGYAPPQQGYAPPQQGYAPPQQGYAPTHAGYAPQNAPGSSIPAVVNTTVVQVHPVPGKASNDDQLLHA